MMNRRPYVAYPLAAALVVAWLVGPPLPVAGQAADTETLYLSGRGKDDAVDWEFRVSDGRRADEWTSLPVPSNWELHGFGTYNYGHDDPKADEVGSYRLRFDVPASWSDRHVDIVFDGAMTDTDVWINGTRAGPTHQGGFYRFSYDVTDLLRPGAENLLEVEVAKMSADPSVNRAERAADFWVFGGIYRPVFLKAYPREHIERVAVDARHDGSLRVELALARGLDPRATSVTARLLDARGEEMAELTRPIDSSVAEVMLQDAIDGVEAWSPEWPVRYTLSVELEGPEGLVHRTSERIGFRTIDVRPRDGIYLNGVKVRLKGVNRHSFWPDAGRTTSRAVSEMDVSLMKAMNMNAVRMSHYPPDKHFLEVTDSLGLLVIDELTGWQDAYDTDVGTPLVRELIERDHNHPSVIMWANGNESGWNRDLDALFAKHDLQDRTVIHPWELFGGINTLHYQPYDCCAGTFFHGREIFMPTEFLHGLYDGGHGAGLEDYWDAVMEHPLAAGGFLWALADEAILRTDLGDTLDTDGNHAPDGIVGPYREKEASFYAIKEIWSPVQVEPPLLEPHFDGALSVENRYHFTNLEDVAFEWRLVAFPGPEADATGHRVLSEGAAVSPDVDPGTIGQVSLDLPDDWYGSDALYLSASDPHGREVYTWTWMIRSPGELQSRWVIPEDAAVDIDSLSGDYLLSSGGVGAEIDGRTGRLLALRQGERVFPLTNGPRLVAGGAEPTGTTTGVRGAARFVEVQYEGNLMHVTWTMLPGGWLELAYRYTHGGELDHMGVTFDFPEAQVSGVRWLGRGPYRVWKNRMRGMTFDVWSKPYNDAITGMRWQYPEFKGHHANLYWAELESEIGPLTIVSGAEDLFLRLFTPSDGVDPLYTSVEFPPGDISFLNAIPPIGTKFHPPEALGPQGQPNHAVEWFDRRRTGDFDVVLYIRPGME